MVSREEFLFRLLLAMALFFGLVSAQVINLMPEQGLQLPGVLNKALFGETKRDALQP